MGRERSARWGMRGWAHLRLVALVFIGEKVGAGQCDVVGERVMGMTIDFIPI